MFWDLSPRCNLRENDCVSRLPFPPQTSLQHLSVEKHHCRCKGKVLIVAVISIVETCASQTRADSPIRARCLPAYRPFLFPALGRTRALFLGRRSARCLRIRFLPFCWWDAVVLVFFFFTSGGGNAACVFDWQNSFFAFFFFFFAFFP